MSELDRELVSDPSEEGTHQRREAPQTMQQEVLTNLLAGLTTSFAAIALGAAFGVASGRGALVGILSAGTIALVTAVLLSSFLSHFPHISLVFLSVFSQFSHVSHYSAAGTRRHTRAV